MLDERARRATLQFEIGQIADLRLWRLDPPVRPNDDAGRLVVLRDAFADLELDLAGGEEALQALAAETQLWLEEIERGRAR